MTIPWRRAPWLLGAAVSAWPSIAAAQATGLDFTTGPWWHGGSVAISYTLTYRQPLVGPLDYGLGISHLDDHRSSTARSVTGGVLSLGLNRAGGGPYALGAAGLGFRSSNGDPDAFWAVGAGYAFRPLSFLSLGLDGQYRVEDQRIRGFWQLDPSDRRGFQLQGRIALRLGRTGSRSAPAVGGGSTGATPQRPPPPEAISTAALAGGASAESAETLAQVVQAALDAMGAPYRWGGSDTNGYDCSGLIQYAYAEYGILLPRRSRDQAKTGVLVDRSLAALRPGDLLGFAINGRGVSHVGLYVGDGQFIHSASSGVRLSSLTADDPDSQWWQERWVVTRRILQ